MGSIFAEEMWKKGKRANHQRSARKDPLVFGRKDYREGWHQDCWGCCWAGESNYRRRPSPRVFGSKGAGTINHKKYFLCKGSGGSAPAAFSEFISPEYPFSLFG